MGYAVDTDVPVDRTKGQIEAMLRSRGASEYASGWSDVEDRIQFRMGDTRIRFTLPRVDPTEPQIATLPNGRERSAEAISRLVAQKDRSRWRSLYLVIKAKLEAVDAGIAVFEREFLAFIVMGDGKETIGDVLVPQLQASHGQFQIAATAGPDGKGHRK